MIGYRPPPLRGAVAVLDADGSVAAFELGHSDKGHSAVGAPALLCTVQYARNRIVLIVQSLLHYRIGARLLRRRQRPLEWGGTTLVKISPAYRKARPAFEPML